MYTQWYVCTCHQPIKLQTVSSFIKLRSLPVHSVSLSLHCKQEVRTIQATHSAQLIVETHSSKEHEGESANSKTELNAILKSLQPGEPVKQCSLCCLHGSGQSHSPIQHHHCSEGEAPLVVLGGVVGWLPWIPDSEHKPYRNTLTVDYQLASTYSSGGYKGHAKQQLR